MKNVKNVEFTDLMMGKKIFHAKKVLLMNGDLKVYIREPGQRSYRRFMTVAAENTARAKAKSVPKATAAEEAAATAAKGHEFSQKSPSVSQRPAFVPPPAAKPLKHQITGTA